MLTAWHGSPNQFQAFNTKYVFLAKNREEASRYGCFLYQVTFVGKPLFETPTIYVTQPANIKELTHVG